MVGYFDWSKTCLDHGKLRFVVITFLKVTFSKNWFSISKITLRQTLNLNEKSIWSVTLCILRDTCDKSTTRHWQTSNSSKLRLLIWNSHCPLSTSAPIPHFQFAFFPGYIVTFALPSSLCPHKSSLALNRKIYPVAKRNLTVSLDVIYKSLTRLSHPWMAGDRFLIFPSTRDERTSPPKMPQTEN